MASKWTTAAAGAGAGALAGGATFGPIGAAGGFVLGGLGGLLQGGATEDAAAAQQAAMDKAMAQLQQYSTESYQRRMSDLKNTMAFYHPADNYLRSIYGGPPRTPDGAPGGNPNPKGWQPGGGVDAGPQGPPDANGWTTPLPGPLPSLLKNPSAGPQLPPPAGLHPGAFLPGGPIPGQPAPSTLPPGSPTLLMPPVGNPGRPPIPGSSPVVGLPPLSRFGIR